MLDMSVRAKILEPMLYLKRSSTSRTSTSPTTWRLRSSSATASRFSISGASSRSAPRTLSTRTRSTRTRRRYSVPSRSPTPAGACRATSREVRSRTRPGRRAAAPSTRAAPLRLRCADGSRVTSPTCSRRAGRSSQKCSTRRSAPSSATSRCFSTADSSVRLPSSAKDGGPALARFLETARAEDPGNPFWKGVRQIVAAEGHVDLEMFEPMVPRQLGVGTSQVVSPL